MLNLGCHVVVVKEGERGLTIHTAQSADSLIDGWGGRSLRAGTYVVDVAGTTGAGDTTIAGFLAGCVRGDSLEHAASLACAAGARCVESGDAISGLCRLAQLESFIASHPPRRSPA